MPYRTEKHRSGLRSSLSFTALSSGAMVLADFALADTRPLMLLWPDQYRQNADGVIVLGLESEATMTLAPEQYLILQDGLLLVTDEFAQAAMVSLPVMGGVRTALLPNLDALRSPDGSIVQAQDMQPIWTGEEQAPRLFHQVDIRRFELAQDLANTPRDDEERGFPFIELAMVAGILSMAPDAPEAAELTPTPVSVPLGKGTTTYVAEASTYVAGGTPIDSDHEYLLAYDNKLYFNASNGLDEDGNSDEDEHFYVFDPNEGNTIKVTAVDALGDTNPVEPGYLVQSGGVIYFSGRDSNDDAVLMSYTPATDTAEIITSATGMESPKYLAAHDGKIYFRAEESGTKKIFVHEPAANTTVAVGNGTDMDASFLAWLEGKLYFTAPDINGDEELHVYDPATPATSRVMDIHASADTGGASRESDPSYTHAHDGKLYFNGEDAAQNEDLYVYDPAAGTTDKIAAVSTLYPGEIDPRYMHAFDGKIYFAGENGETDAGSGYDIEVLMIYDPIADAAVVVDSVEDLDPVAFESLAALNGLLYMALKDVNDVDELYAYDPDVLYV